MSDADSATLHDPARPGWLAVWMQASRAWTLGMPFMCVSVGTFTALYTAGVFSPWKYLLAAVSAMALQAGANMVNDYYDFVSGTDSPDWQSPENFGPGLVIQRGLLEPPAVFQGGIVSFVIGVALGLVLAHLCGWPILVLGLIGVFGSYFYTGAPLSLAYRGLGDFMVFALMGPGYVMGAYYVQALHFSWSALIASIPIGLLCSGVLQANNLRDIDNDAAHGKRTMAVIIGRVAAVKELQLSNLFAYLGILLGVIAGQFPWLALAVAITIPHAREEVRLVSEGPDPERHNRAMALSGQLQFEFGAVLVAALVLRHLL
ncbi:MAG TPA: 1,4-dihydroxy-2-naphthoate octaprenyltransferase [Candidatus Binataceae bacterium]|jgi:1,4-dihydroxy-2-naphthoate octaprenyltransferase|nr:1,4-dihydroxy-2-naphthoate octaprenyltransferase [Candidatus Binataceae bacterium]